MSILDKVNIFIDQITGFAAISIGELIGSTFMRVVMFLAELLLGT